MDMSVKHCRYGDTCCFDEMTSGSDDDDDDDPSCRQCTRPHVSPEGNTYCPTSPSRPLGSCRYDYIQMLINLKAVGHGGNLNLPL